MNYTKLPDGTIKACLNNSEQGRNAYARIASQFDNEKALIEPNTLLERQCVYNLIHILDEGNEYHIVDELDALIQRVEQARPNRASGLRATCNRIINALEAIKVQCRLIYENVHAYDNDPLY